MYITPYIIDLHHSPRAGIHYDFRIKYPTKNKLVSFALPKARFPKVGEKLLAVRTPDHPMKWLTFEGDIPGGKSGDIKKVQRGFAEVSSWSDNLIVLRVDGPIASGKYGIIHMKKNEYKQKNNDWIIIKSNEKN